jgi:hypothetical protein
MPALMAASAMAFAADIDPARLKRFAPLPAVVHSKTNPITPAKTDLGRMLYCKRKRYEEAIC